jgi:hypothetical protein
MVSKVWLSNLSRRDAAKIEGRVSIEFSLQDFELRAETIGHELMHFRVTSLGHHCFVAFVESSGKFRVFTRRDSALVFVMKSWPSFEGRGGKLDIPLGLDSKWGVFWSGGRRRR